MIAPLRKISPLRQWISSIVLVSYCHFTESRFKCPVFSPESLAQELLSHVKYKVYPEKSQVIFSIDMGCLALIPKAS